MIRNTTARYLVWALAAWIGSWCMTVPAPGFATEGASINASNQAYRAADLAARSALDGRGGGDDEAIFDDQDDLDTDAAVFAGLKDTQPFAPVGDASCRRIAVSARACTPRSTFLVEPHFLRYCRLLN